MDGLANSAWTIVSLAIVGIIHSVIFTPIIIRNLISKSRNQNKSRKQSNFNRNAKISLLIFVFTAFLILINPFGLINSDYFMILPFVSLTILLILEIWEIIRAAFSYVKSKF